MSKVVNLNRFRKRRAKEAKERQAERNRRYHGRTKAEREQEEAARRRLEKQLDGAYLVRERVDVSELEDDSLGSAADQFQRLESATAQIPSLSDYAAGLRAAEEGGQGSRLAPPGAPTDDGRSMRERALLKNATHEQFDCFVQLVVLVAYADDDLAAAEVDVLVDRVLELTEGRADRARLRELMERLPPKSRDGENWRVEAIAPLRDGLTDPELRVAVFRLAVDVARAHQGIGFRESRMLVNLVEQLEIDPDLVSEVMH